MLPDAIQADMGALLSELQAAGLAQRLLSRRPLRKFAPAGRLLYSIAPIGDGYRYCLNVKNQLLATYHTRLGLQLVRWPQQKILF